MLRQHRAQQVTGDAEVTCYAEDDETSSAADLCMTNLEINDESSTHELNWAKKDLKAFKAQVILMLETPPQCGHLDGKLVKRETLPVGHGDRCELGDQRGATIQIMGKMARVAIFSSSYPTYDPEVDQ